MSLEDPFFVVKDEVQKALLNARNLYQRWCELMSDPITVSKEEYDWLTNELRNSVRSIEWDLEDLEETISIVEKNPKKFRIDEAELLDRRGFINRTRQTVQDMKSHLTSPHTKAQEEKKARNSLMSNVPRSPQDKYQRLDVEIERSNQRFIEDAVQQQQLIVRVQDEQLESVGASVGVLKTMSRQIGNELDEQTVMLDDFAHEMDTSESKMDNVMKKMAKAMHMSNDRRQWMAIGLLLAIMVVVIIMFFVV